MKTSYVFMTMLWTTIAPAQGVPNSPPEASISPTANKAIAEQRSIVHSANLRAVAGKPARRTIRFGDGAVELTNVRVEPVDATDAKVQGACQVRVLINDTPVRMTVRQLEGTRGQPRPIPPPEDTSAPAGLAGTVRLPAIYPVLLEPVVQPDYLGPKDRLTIELSSPAKKTDCAAKVSVETRQAR
jgi:hypothetical protein